MACIVRAMAVSTHYLGDPATSALLGDHLELLARIGQDFATSLDIGKTLHKALARIASHLDAEAASLFLVGPHDDELVCEACVGPVDITGLRIASSQGIVGRAVAANRCQMVRDARLDPDFARSVDEGTGFTTRSILCAPLSVKDRRVGAIELVNKATGDGLFSEPDRQMLEALASSAALAVINARLTSQLIAQEKLRRELELAADIQRNLLPRRQPEPYPVCGVNRAARSVSGDFYDIFTLSDGRIAFNIADVSGKGINAALLMAKTSSLYRCLGKTIDDPSVLLARINRELCETGTRGMFVTMIGGVYDPTTSTVYIANAGHEPALELSSEATRRYGAQVPPLGIAAELVPDAGFPVTEIALNGSTLCIFTDGVTECRAGNGQMLGASGFEGMLRTFAEAPLEQRLARLLEALERPDAALHDDLTIVLIEAVEGA